MSVHYDNETKQHGSAEQDLAAAIRESKSTSQTVELAVSEALESALYAECEGHDDNGTFWGEDVDGNEWQVRLV